MTEFDMQQADDYTKPDEITTFFTGNTWGIFFNDKTQLIFYIEKITGNCNTNTTVTFFIRHV